LRKLFILIVTLGVMAVSLSSVGALSQPSTGSARLHEINRSGIQARMLFLDTGDPATGLVVSGTATGLDPAAAYISLRYDTGSVPGGPLACEPSDSSTLTEAQMFVGSWTVAADGTGTLFAIKTDATYTALTEIGAISIRRVPGGTLQACGQIHRNP